LKSLYVSLKIEKPGILQIVRRLSTGVRSDFLSHVFSLSSTAFIGNAAYGLSQLIIVKFLSLENYGYAACILSYVNFCFYFVTLGYETPIVSAKSSIEAKGLASLSLMLAVIFSLLASLSFGPLCSVFFKKNGVLNFEIFWIIFLIILSLAVSSVARMLLIYKGHFKILGRVLIFSNSMRAIGPFLVLPLIRDWRAIIYGDIIGHFLWWIVVARNMRKIPWGIAKNLFHQYIFCPKKLVPSRLIDTFSFSLFVPAVSFFYTPKDAGFFALIYRIVLLPISFFGKFMGDVYHQRVVGAINQNRGFVFLKRVALFSVVFSVFFGVIILAALWFYSKYFSSLSNFHEYFESCIYLVMVGISMFVVSPLSRVLLISSEGASYKLIYDVTIFFSLLLYWIFIFIMRPSFSCYIKWFSFISITNRFLCYFIISRFVERFSIQDSEKKTTTGSSR
jgi:O-antigen/teichoic acid export membrane protein